jgi:uncharacterized protein (DUF983 family)
MQYVYAIPVTLALLVIGFLFDLSPQPGRDGLLAIALACATCVVALLFVPIRNKVTVTLIDAVIVTAICVAVFLWFAGTALPWPPLLRLATTCLLVTFAALSLLQLIPGQLERNRLFVLVGLSALIAAPVWLGPIAEVAGNPAGLTNLIAGISPLSAFAVALDADILRTNWFYTHSALGSLRYEYFAWSTYLVVLVGISILFAAGSRSYKNHRGSGILPRSHSERT